MRLLRTWPHRIPQGRSGWVEDDIERVVIRGYDARALVDVQDDVLLLEWDIAVSKEDLAHFAEHAATAPAAVLAAPYRLYPEGNPGMVAPIWAPRTMPGNVPVTEGQPACHYFGFGMVYLPATLLREFADTWLTNNPSGNLTDETFASWHYRTQPPEVPICWHVRPVHLHYSPKDLSCLTRAFRPPAPISTPVAAR